MSESVRCEFVTTAESNGRRVTRKYAVKGEDYGYVRQAVIELVECERATRAPVEDPRVIAEAGKREADSATEGPGDIVRKELKLARKIIIVRGYRECPFRHGVVCRVTGSQLGCYPMGKWPKGAERCPLTQYADVVVRREKRRQAVRKERGPWWLWGVAGAFVAAGAALLGYGAAMVWRYLW